MLILKLFRTREFVEHKKSYDPKITKTEFANFELLFIFSHIFLNNDQIIIKFVWELCLILCTNSVFVGSIWTMSKKIIAQKHFFATTKTN